MLPSCEIGCEIVSCDCEKYKFQNNTIYYCVQSCEKPLKIPKMFRQI